MRDRLGPGTVLGYCTNVHAGSTYDDILVNLRQHALKVKQQVSPDAPMGVGLWLSTQAARQMLEDDSVPRLARWLQQHGLEVFTLNGFPYGDFHGPTVKHRVYQPDWRNPKRLDYTLDLARVLAGLLRPDMNQGSISTLPVSWHGGTETNIYKNDSDHETMRAASEHLLRVVDHLARLEQETGKLIHLDLEPEPGCVLQTSRDVIRLFANHLDKLGDPSLTRRHLRVCHDICHGAVMFEDHAGALERYDGAGIRVGKAQISSALDVPFDLLSPQDRLAAAAQLKQFQEDRYLHQTMVSTGDRCETDTQTLYEDLPEALASCSTDAPPTGHWRVHFHVPIFLNHIGLIRTTRDQIIDCVTLLRDRAGVRHFEAETYAWGVLPQSLRVADTADGIAQELTWLINHAPIEAPA